MGKLKNIIYEILKYVLFFAIFCLLNIASIGELKPFAFGMMLSLVFLNQNFFILSFCFMLSVAITDFTLTTLIGGAVVILVCGLFLFLHKKFKKNINVVLFILYGFLSQFGFLFFNTSSAESFLLALASVAIGIIAMLCYKTFFRALYIKGIQQKWTVDEYVSLGVFLFAVGAGVANLPYLNGIPLILISAILVLFASSCLKTGFLFSFATIYGFGISFSIGNVEFLAVIMSWCVACSLMKGSSRLYQILGLFLCDVLVGIYFFNYYTVYNLLAIVVAGIIFLCIPKKLIAKMYGIVNSGDAEYSVKTVIKHFNDKVSKRILQTSNVFVELQTAFQLMIKENISKNEACKILSRELIQKVCEKCEKKDRCLRLNYENIQKHIQKIVSTALDRGKVTVIDMPSAFASNCCRINVVLPFANNLCNNFRQQQRLKTSLDGSRLLLGEQLFGVSEILKSLANDVKLDVSYNPKLKSEIIEGLLYQNIVCSDVVVYYQNGDKINLSLQVKTEDVNKYKISKIVSEIFKTKLTVFDIKQSEKSGYSIVLLKQAINFDIVFGCSGVKKSGSDKSGDTYSILRIDDAQFLISLCDGMGSGNKAEQTSALAICLIENFYKAGFNSELIISSVNKLLTMKGDDNFSALDVCIFNLMDGVCDIVKLGAPCSFLKSNDKTSILEGASLPMGILDEVSPEISSHILKNGDMLVLVTDGIVDAYGGNEALCAFLNNVSTTNPQVLADSILEFALTKNRGEAKDDMTVLVGRIWSKI